jgi:hypothetical protein
MSKKNVQRILWLLIHPAWTVTGLLLVSWGIIAPLVNYVIPEAWFSWLASSLGSLVLTAFIYFLATAIILLPLIVIKRMNWAQLKEAVALQKRPQLVMLPWSFYAWGLYFGLSLIVTFLLSILNLQGLDLYQKQQVGFDNLHYGYEFVAAFVALVVLAPLFEEIMFRGYLYGRLRTHWGAVLSALITSATFALVHFQLNVGIDVFILSLFLCLLREKFDSIWPGVFVHAFKNSLAYVFLFILPLYGINLIQ